MPLSIIPAIGKEPKKLPQDTSWGSLGWSVELSRKPKASWKVRLLGVFQQRDIPNTQIYLNWLDG